MHPRKHRWIPLVAALGLATAASSARPLQPDALFPAPVYVSMKQDGSLWRYPDGARWRAASTTLYDAVTPDGRLVLATVPSEHRVAILDAARGKRLALLDVGRDPKGVKVTPDGTQAWVSNQGSDSISVIDLDRHVVVDTLHTGKGPHNVRFTRNGRTAYVTLQNGGALGVIDVASRKQVRTIPLPGIVGPHNLDLSPDERTAWVRDFVHNVAVVDLSTGRVRKVIRVGAGHGGIDVSPDGRYVATGAIGGDAVSLIDPESFHVRNVKVGKGPHGVRFSRDGRRLYVSVTGENRVVVVDPATARVLGERPAGAFPFWVAVPGNP